MHKYFWVYYNMCVICVIANSSANFCIYSLVSEEFRQSFKRFFSLNMGVSSYNVTEGILRSPLSPMSLSPKNGGRNEEHSTAKNSNEEETLI